jgi:F-type H+-transporting ATPase subunit a
MAAEEVHIALAAETIGHIGPLPITNTLLTTWIVTAALLAFAYFATRKQRKIPHGLQNIAEIVIEGLQGVIEPIAHDKTKVFMPILVSFFLFILLGNYFGLLPGVGTLGFYEMHEGHEVFVPFFRSINSDLNTTLALGIVSIVYTHYLAVKYLGFAGYIGKFLSLNPIMLFVGVLEFFGEFTKIVSLSFRLFGNVFAGEVLLTTASSKLFAYLVPIPFYSLELLVGFVQAFIFTMLTMTFLVILTDKHEAH